MSSVLLLRGLYTGNHWKRTFTSAATDLCETYFSAQGVFTLLMKALFGM